MSKRYQGGVLGVGFNPIRAPNAPTIGTATAGGNNCASVPFTAPSCVGGSAITSYTYQSNPAGYSGTVSGSPITVTGLVTGQSYSFGVFALNSYGPSPQSAFSNSITAVLDGTFGIFALGATPCVHSTTRNKYTFSGCVVSAGTAATAASYGGSAAGNGTIGVFALGCVACVGASTSRNKYTYASGVVSAGGAATGFSNRGSAAGNSTIGIFALGGTNIGTTSRNKYTYSNDTVAAAGAATVAAARGAAAGNSTTGIFALGVFYFCGNSVFTCGRDKYNYSNCAVSAATSATQSSADGYAAGNSTAGIFALGTSSGGSRLVLRNKYTYSGDVVSAGGAATAQSAEGSAAGNSTVGIFALSSTNSGVVATRNKYTYSGCVVTAGAAATAASRLGAAASNGISGVTI